MFLADQRFVEMEELTISGFPIELSEKVFQKVAEGIMITDLSKRILHVNPAFEIVTGFQRDEVIGHTPKILQSGIHKGDFYQSMWTEVQTTGEWQGEIWNRRKNGEIYPEWLNIMAIRDNAGEIRNYCGIFTDLTDRKSAEKELKEMALTDSLTGVSNRYDFAERMQQLLKTSEKYTITHSLLFLDLDRFKQINDSLGHDIGDRLLVEVSQRIRELIKNKDIIARYGGDEFVIALSAIKHPREAAHLAESIIDALGRPFLLNEEEIYISTSIGISLYPNDGQTADELLRKADKAMYFSKENGRNQFCFFHDELKPSSKRHVVLESELRKAIELKTVKMVYQPKIDIVNNRITGYEALVRWESEKLGQVSPAEFIPHAESSGLIAPLSELIFEKVCEDFIQFNMERGNKAPISINISGMHFQQSQFVSTLKSVFERMNCQPSFFELELTEHTIMANGTETADKLNELKNLGFKISVDDFGTGYSSLSYLHRFPIDYLKIDRSFISNINGIKENELIVNAIINMAASLQMNVIAEGAETTEQVELLRRLGCGIVQGYYFSKPMPAESVSYFVEEWNISQQERV